MTVCAACSEHTDDPVIVRLDRESGTHEVCRSCLPGCLRRGTLHPSPPTLKEEFETIFDDDHEVLGGAGAAAYTSPDRASGFDPLKQAGPGAAVTGPVNAPVGPVPAPQTTPRHARIRRRRPVI